MNPTHTILRSCAVASALLLLGACESTTFEHPPVAESGCDAALAGNWFSLADTRDESDGEAELLIDGSCKLLLIEHKKDGVVSDDPTLLHIGTDERQGYLWVDAAWAYRRADSKELTVPGDVYVLRYRIHGDKLELQTLNDKAIAHRIIDGDLRGVTRKSEHDLFNRLTGTVTPQQLRRHDFFADKPVRFKRHEPKPESVPAERP